MPCDAQTILAEAKCFICLDESTRRSIRTELLRQIAGSTESPSELSDQAGLFIGLSPGQQQAIQAQLLCEISKGTVLPCNPTELLDAGACYACLNDERLIRSIQTGLLCQIANSEPPNCDPADMLDSAKNLSGSDREIDGAQIVLLCQIKGGECDPQALIDSGKCFDCLGVDQINGIQIVLLCQIMNLP